MLATFNSGHPTMHHNFQYLSNGYRYAETMGLLQHHSPRIKIESLKLQMQLDLPHWVLGIIPQWWKIKRKRERKMKWKLRLRRISTSIMEHQMEKNMEPEMETGFIQGFIGLRVLHEGQSQSTLDGSQPNPDCHE